MKTTYLLLLIIIGSCLFSCDKKDNTLSSEPKHQDSIIIIASNTTSKYPDTDTYIGTYMYSNPSNDGYGDYCPAGSGTISPFTFYVIHTNDTELVFVNGDKISNCASINDTFTVNDTNIYVTPYRFYTQYAFSLIASDSLKCNLQYFLNICPDGVFFTGNFLGKLQKNP